jgi:hypothetical protein
MNFKMQILIHFWATLFSFGSCVFGYPFTNIAWNFGWVEVIKSLAKDDFFWILQKFSHTLNLDFSRLWLLLTISACKVFAFFVIQGFNNVVEWTIKQTTIGWINQNS